MVIDGDTRVGEGNRFFPFSSIGLVPQDLKFRGEPARVEIGDRNVFREGTTVHRGTAGGGGVTRIGSDNLFMAQVHVAHDCVVGSHTVLANGSALSGHVEVQDHATLGGFSGVHQFCRVGTHAFMGGATIATRDVAPYSLTVGNRAHFFGLNVVGLRRRGFSAEAIAALRRAYRVLARPASPLAEALRRVEEEGAPHRGGPRRRRVRPLLEARRHPPAPPRRRRRRGGAVGRRDDGRAPRADRRATGASPSSPPRGRGGPGGGWWRSPSARRPPPSSSARWTSCTGSASASSAAGSTSCRRPGAREAVMAGQVKHRRIFSDVVPDLKLLGVLARLAFQNTDSLIGAVADALAREGITLLPSIAFLGDQLAVAGRMTRRPPDREERRDVEYGETVARALAGMDLGQTAVVKHRAAVALEAMEGTDETIRRAGRIAGPGTTVVKVSKPRQDMRFDVPVVGEGTLEAMREAGSRVLALDAGRTLVIDRQAFLARADEDGVAVLGLEPGAGGGREG